MSTNAYAPPGTASVAEPSRNDKLLFWACFASIVATAFGFVIRGQIINTWAIDYGLDATQKGKINGVGLWPFAISIVLFSLIIDRIGYGKAMIFAFVSHISAAVLMILTPQLSGGDKASAYNILYYSNLILALGNGTIEAVANPVVANLFPRDKTKYLNMLHAGWPGGLVLGGIIALLMGDVNWQYKVALIFLPVVFYAFLMLGRQFPVSERVTAGVSFNAMLREVGVVGAAIILAMIVRELGGVFLPADRFGEMTSNLLQLAIWAGLVLLYGYVVNFAIGQPMFIFLMLIMIPLATTELGTDGWITDLMTPAMSQIGLAGGWVLVYTSAIMLVLRFYAGPIVHKLSPLGLLCASSVIAAGGLLFLSRAEGATILVAATLYGLGKSFFWPTMLGVTAEQFPRGGALTLNTMGGLGMLAVGILGAPFQGNIQDTKVDRDLAGQNKAVYERVVDSKEKSSVFGPYHSIDEDKVKALPAEDKGVVAAIQDAARRNVLVVTAIFPCIMLACYLSLFAYFRTRGGYKAQVIVSEREEALMMAGGTPTAAEF